MQKIAAFAWFSWLLSTAACAGAPTAAPQPPRPQPPSAAAAASQAHAPSSTPAPQLAKSVGPTLSLQQAMPESSGVPQASPAPASAEHGAPSCALQAEGPATGFYVRDARPKGKVVLTFDDGPHPGKTPKVLNLLRKHKMNAVFFLVGAAIRPDTYHLVQRMVSDGHVLGTHSYNHDIKMATRRPGRGSIEYVRGQHEVTRILIDLALMAQSESDFKRLYTRVFEQKRVVYMPGGKLRQWSTFLARHRALLGESGYAKHSRPYDVLYSRPPGGAPYLDPSQKWQRDVYDTALREAGLVNVMWHDESGDAHAEKRHDVGFLTSNLRRAFRAGGVTLIHDYIRTDVLTTELALLAKSKTAVVPISEMVHAKYGCSENSLRTALRPVPKEESIGDAAVASATPRP